MTKTMDDLCVNTIRTLTMEMPCNAAGLVWGPASAFDFADTWPELSGAISRQRSEEGRGQEPSCCYATMMTDAGRWTVPGQWAENPGITRLVVGSARRSSGPPAGWVTVGKPEIRPVSY